MNEWRKQTAERRREFNRVRDAAFNELMNDAWGCRCFYCGASEQITVDHKLPLRRGGTNDMQNLCLCCKSGNSSKNTLSQAEFIETLKLGKVLSPQGLTPNFRKFWSDVGRRVLPNASALIVLDKEADELPFWAFECNVIELYSGRSRRLQSENPSYRMTEAAIREGRWIPVLHLWNHWSQRIPELRIT